MYARAVDRWEREAARANQRFETWLWIVALSLLAAGILWLAITRSVGWGQNASHIPDCTPGVAYPCGVGDRAWVIDPSTGQVEVVDRSDFEAERADVLSGVDPGPYTH